MASWGIFVILHSWLTEKRDKKYDWRLSGLSALSGSLLAISFPGLLPVPIFMFLGFVPLLMVEYELSQSDEKAIGRKVFRHAFNAFLVFNILTTWWVSNAALAPGVFASVANALLMSTAFWLFHKTKKFMPQLGYTAFITFWICYEYMHLNWDLSWPWLIIGNSFAQVPWWVQWYEFTGVIGGTVLVLWVNVLLFRIIKGFNEEGAILRKDVIQISAVFLLPLIVSLFMYFNYEEKGEAVNVVAVQPNYEPHHEKFTIPENVQVNHFLELSSTRIDSLTDYLVFPETSFGKYIEDSSFKSSRSLIKVREYMQSYPGLTVVMGANVYHDFEKGEPLTAHARVLGKGKNIRYLETYNAAIELSGTSNEVPLHKKSKLVPGPEIFPFKKILFFLEPLVNQLGGTTAGLGTQEDYVIFEGGAAKVGPAICYESVYGEYVGGYVRNGAELIFVMTNDGWWDDTPGYRQHLYFSSLRAIENRRAIVRAANTGSSAFVNQRGDILKKTAYNVPIAIAAEMHKNSEITFYTKWGDMIARIALFLAIIMVLNTIVKSRMKDQTVLEE
jgi:apolipoprotein N-acyltransferase